MQLHQLASPLAFTLSPAHAWENGGCSGNRPAVGFAACRRNPRPASLVLAPSLQRSPLALFPQVYKVVLDGVQLYAAKVLDLGLTDLHVQNIFLRVRKNERRNWLNE